MAVVVEVVATDGMEPLHRATHFEYAECEVFFLVGAGKLVSAVASHAGEMVAVAALDGLGGVGVEKLLQAAAV
jgi:hypothetical protein